MKKITLLAVVAIAVLSMTSCKKDRTCTCTETSGGSTTIHTIVVTKATKKSVAAGECASGTSTVTYSGQTSIITRSCTIK